MNLSDLIIPQGCNVSIIGDNATKIDHVEHYHRSGSSYVLSHHPLAKYCVRPEKAEDVIEWMRHAISAQPTPKEQLAVLKAATECHPQAIYHSVTYEAFTGEFKLELSEESFKKWIKGNRKAVYQKDELGVFVEALENIMKR